MTKPPAPSPEPISAVALPDAALIVPPEPQTAAGSLLSLRDRVWPLTAHATLFAMGLAGGLAVATAASLTLHYLGSGADRQLASARIDVPRSAPEPLDLEIQKAKAELDAALKARNGS